VLVPPRAINVGFAEIAAVTAGPTVTEILSTPLDPPSPTHVTVYVASAVGVTFTLPVVSPPVLKMFPEQLFALVLDQLIVLVPPDAINPGAAETETETGGPTATMNTLEAVAPPGARQSTEY
jgi:hypothetical protein